jgi:hypothetical protein
MLNEIEYNNVHMYFSSGISTIFGYSDADWKFNMGTKARNVFWMSENKQTTYLNTKEIVEHLGPGLGQVQTCVGIKPVNVTPHPTHSW